MNFFRTIVCCVTVLIVSGSYAQKVPEWVKGYHLDMTHSEIKVVKAVGSTEQEARNEAIKNIIADQSHATGLRANVNVGGDGTISVSGSDNLKVKARVIDEYTQRMGQEQYRVYVLAQVAKNPTFAFEDVKVTDKYSFSPACFIPGMAQFRKGSVGKGTFFIAAEALCVGGIIWGASQHSSYMSKINTTHNANDKKLYKDRADDWTMVRNVAIAGTAAFYLWSFIDGAMAKGKKHVVVDKARFAFVPYYDAESTGLAMRVDF